MANYAGVNEIVAQLSIDIANLEEKLKETEKKLEESKAESNLLSSEVQKKAIEITNLKKENDKHNQTIADLNKKIEEDKKLNDELTETKIKQEKQNYELLLEQKNKIETERNEIEKQYFETKKNYEKEQKKYLDLDKTFYEYKKEVEKDKSSGAEKIANLEKELSENIEKLNNANKTIEEKEKKLKESMEIIETLQKENERIKSNMEDLKVETHNKIEKMKAKVEKATKSAFSPDNILNIVGENIHCLFKEEFSLSINTIINEIFKNFITYMQSMFGSNENGDRYIHNDENIYVYFLKDIYLYIYFYVFNLKKSKNEDIYISNSDFTEEIINNLTNEIYNNNIIHFSNESSEKVINEYLNKLKSLGVSDDNLSTIKSNYLEKNEKFKIYLLNMIKTLIKKCADTIRNSTIEMNNTILYDFRSYNGEEFSFAKNNLQIYCDKITNENIEAIINILKHPSEKINRIHFNNNFDKDLSEFTIQKLLLNIMTYNQELLSLNFDNCEIINNSVMSYIMFIVRNLKTMKILGFESCKLNDNHLKIIIEGIKDNNSIVALMLRKNNITSQGGFYIAEYLNDHTNLRQLFLGGNNIRDKGLKTLLTTMSTTNKNITHLDLSSNNFTLEDYNSIIEYLKVDPILNSLDISGNKLDLKSSINLGATLCSVKNVKSLNMAKMGIISDLIPNLFKSFNLEEIILDENSLEGVGLLMLGKGFMGNKILKKISLKNTQFSSIGLASLLGILKNTKDFKELHLENNNIDDTGVGAIKQTLENKKFKIFVSKSMVNQELFKDDALGKESNIIMV